MLGGILGIGVALPSYLSCSSPQSKSGGRSIKKFANQADIAANDRKKCGVAGDAEMELTWSSPKEKRSQSFLSDNIEY